MRLDEAIQVQSDFSTLCFQLQCGIASDTAEEYWYCLISVAVLFHVYKLWFQLSCGIASNTAEEEWCCFIFAVGFCMQFHLQNGIASDTAEV